MSEKIGENVSVYSLYNHQLGQFAPKFIKWQQQVFKIEKIGLHYTLYRGRTLVHMFSVSDKTHFFLLSLNTQNLNWRLEEVSESE